MTGKRYNVRQLFDQLAAKNRAAYDDPESVRFREAERARRQTEIAAEIAAGLRDEDGWPIEPESTEPDDRTAELDDLDNDESAELEEDE